MSQDNIRVLIVDDIPQVRLGLTTMLKLAAKTLTPSIEVIGEAQNGAEAIHQAQKLQPDIILMDLEMPICDGFEATRQIKANLPNIHIIILSIHAGIEERKLAMTAGADYFIEKGASLEELLQAIRGKIKSL